MCWKLNKIEFQNFKFFRNSFSLEPKGLHVLVYGENGSGKSSVTQGFYTFIESRQKTIDDVKKYFIQANSQHLRNRFSSADEGSFIKVTYSHYPQTTPPVADKIYTISDSQIDTHIENDDFLAFTLLSSDFFSYKVLNELTYEKNSRELNLYKVFNRDVFKLLQLSKSYTDIDGHIPANGGKTAYEWWKYIKEAPTLLPLSKKHHFLKSDVKYIRYKQLISEFEAEIQTAFTQIEMLANHILHINLELPMVDVSLDMSQILFDQYPAGHPRSRNGELQVPVISLTAKINEDNIIDDVNKNITHLATFFNEAKLTCIGLALRVAISDYKLITTGDVAPVLCIDDLLVSLDMSNRMPVIDLLLEKAQNRQMLIFTHDRAFYNIMIQKIEALGLHEYWKFEEFYRSSADIDGDVPKCLRYEHSTPLDLAKKYYRENDFYASANALRRNCEEQLCRLLPDYKWGDLVEDKLEPTRKINLSGMISAWQLFKHEIGFNEEPMPDMHFYRQRLMNPMSHDDRETPIFREELVKAIKDSEQLNKVKRTNFVKTKECSSTVSYRVNFPSPNNSEWAEVYFRELFTEYEYNGQRYRNNPEICIISNSSPQIGTGVKRLNYLCKIFNYILFGKDKTQYKDYMDISIQKLP